MKRVLVIAGLIVLSCAGYAQILKPVPISYLNANRDIQQNNSFAPFILKRAFVPSDNLQFSNPNNLKCVLAKGAIFCHMEDAIYSHLNFWVKFRMGTDDRYSN